MITYEPFWTKLKAKKITTYALIKKYKISGNTLNRLKHNKPIDTTGISSSNWAMVASAAGLAGLLSLLTSLAGLPELKNNKEDNKNE